MIPAVTFPRLVLRGFPARNIIDRSLYVVSECARVWWRTYVSPNMRLSLSSCAIFSMYHVLSTLSNFQAGDVARKVGGFGANAILAIVKMGRQLDSRFKIADKVRNAAHGLIASLPFGNLHRWTLPATCTKIVLQNIQVGLSLPSIWRYRNRLSARAHRQYEIRNHPGYRFETYLALDSKSCACFAHE